jgi:APA family basic amino acid/polyamine antiporter
VTSASVTQASAPGGLLRVLGVGFGVAVVVGNTIGAGILRAPAEVARQLPDAPLFIAVWAIGGLYALLGAVQIAELGAMIPRSGGQYVFSRRALGEYAGFVVGWSDWLSTCGAAAAAAIVAAEFAASLLSGSDRAVPAVATVAVVAFAAVQWRGIRWGGLAQNVTSAVKALAFAALGAGAFLVGTPAPDVASGAHLVPTGFALLTAIVISLQAVIYTYDGWTGVVYFSEEVEDAGRNVPRALFGGILSIVAIYLAINLALLYVLPVSAIGDRPFAAGALAEATFGRFGATAFTAVVLLSMLSAINAYQLMASRVVFAMSRDGLLSRRVAAVNAGGTPALALFLSTAVAVLFVVFARTFQTVITVLAFFFVANYTLSFVAIIVLRRREATAVRPYRAWGYPWSTAVALAGSVGFLIGAAAGDTRNTVVAGLLLAVSYPVYRVVRSRGIERGSASFGR